MQVDWTMVARFAGPVLGAAVGATLTKLIQDRPRLVTYYSHAGAHIVTGSGATPPIQIHSHSVVIKNTGRKPATNVRVGHHSLKDISFTIFPSVAHTVDTHPSGGADIVFPTLVGREQVTISYLYFPPIIYPQINSYVKSEEGLAKVLEVFPQPQPARWFVRLMWTFAVTGMVTWLYVAWELLRWWLR